MRSKAAILFSIMAMLASSTSGAHEAQSHTGGPPVQSQRTIGADEEASRNYFTDLPLLNQKGERVRFYSDVLKDRIVLISFVYTNCTDACPLIVQKLSEIKDQLGDVFGKRVFFVLMSVDPLRDTPEALAKYARQHKAEHAGWVFLTGEKSNVDRILTRLGQYTERPDAHSTLLLAGNVPMRHWTKISPAASAAAVAAKLQDFVQSPAAARTSSKLSGSSLRRQD